MKSNRAFLLFLSLSLATFSHAQRTGKIPLPEDLQNPYLTKVTSFGQRCDWSHDGKRLIFLEKTFGDVYEVEVATGALTPLTHHFFHEGFVRALYLANGDILLSGSKTFDAEEPWKSRHPSHAELWVLKRDLSEPPTRLGAFCKEGPTASRSQMKISWTIDDIYLADIVYENGTPKLANQKTIITSADLPGAVNGWLLETQNFRTPDDKELIFNAHYPSIEYEAEVMGYDFATGEIVNYSQRPDRYDEPEGIFPDGKYTLVESTRHHPTVEQGRKVWDYIDLYKLALDGSGQMERITYFNRDKKYKATNPVVSDDGRCMAFQYSVVGETTGIGHGIVIWDFDKEARLKAKVPERTNSAPSAWLQFQKETLPKSRVIVLTDMLNEPDDSQTMVRLLMYSNELDIEGLIAVSSCHQYAGKDDEDPVRNDVQPSAIIERIEAYRQVRPNLLQHASGWPTADYLLSVTGHGPSGYGMWDVGDGHSTSGSEIIINALLKEDPRPLHLCINAGANTLAQAIWDLKKRVSEEQFTAALTKLRVYDDAGQDNAGAWIASSYPKVHYMRSKMQVFNFMNNNGPVVWDDWGGKLYNGEGQHYWAMTHVMIGHGPLGALYPIRKRWKKDIEWHTIEGGGTSTWIGHVNRGLWHPEQMTWGGWGGRFEGELEKNVLADQLRWAELVHTEDEYKPWYMYPQASDKWKDPETEKTYEEIGAPIFRWRRAYQNDFQARMDWCIESFDDANHNPVAAVNGDASDAFIYIDSKTGEQLTLDASASSDPDGDSLSYRWFIYPEAGTYPWDGEPQLSDQSSLEFTSPTNAQGQSLHIILEVRDASPIIPLYDYRRIIVTLQQ